MSVEGSRANEGKIQLSYLTEFPNALTLLCRIAEGGAQKYSRGNWKKGLDDYELQDSLLRHLLEGLQDIEEGQTMPNAIEGAFIMDLDSGEPSLGHALWNLMALIEQRYRRGINLRIDMSTIDDTADNTVDDILEYKPPELHRRPDQIIYPGQPGYYDPNNPVRA